MLTTTKVVVFKEGNGEYAIDVEFVGSIERMSHINPIPQQPSYVKGLVLVRDELVPVFDLHEILYGSSLRLTDQSRLIIIHTNVFPIALIIEEAKELIEIEQESMKQIDLLTHKKTPYFAGVINLDGRLITVIHPNELIKCLDGFEEIYDYIMKEKNKRQNANV